LPEPPGVVIYAPLGDTPVEPDVVVFSGRPGRVMLLHEAALRAGVRAHAPLFGRPTCMALPAALAGGVVLSTGCIGNRVYTDVGEDEIYVTIPGRDLARLADALGASRPRSSRPSARAAFTVAASKTSRGVPERKLRSATRLASIV